MDRGAWGYKESDLSEQPSTHVAFPAVWPPVNCGRVSGHEIKHTEVKLCNVDDGKTPAYVILSLDLIYILSGADSVFILLILAQEQLSMLLRSNNLLPARIPDKTGMELKHKMGTMAVFSL